LKSNWKEAASLALWMTDQLAAEAQRRKLDDLTTMAAMLLSLQGFLAATGAFPREGLIRQHLDYFINAALGALPKDPKEKAGPIQ
jgi:hypothetical protein